MANQPRKDRKPTNGWDVLWHIVTQSFNSGYALFLLGGLTFLGALWIVAGRLESHDLKELLISLFGLWFQLLGWLLFVVGSIIYFLAVRWMKRQHDAEIDRQREIIDRFLPPDKSKELDLK
jgi:hypothetical protein